MRSARLRSEVTDLVQGRATRQFCVKGAFNAIAAPDQPESSGAASGEIAAQNTACPLMTLGSHVEKNGRYVTMLIALKIAR